MKGILPVNKDSFFCGLNRKDGLHLKILYEPELVYCQVNLDNRFEGFTNVLHGGIIFGILDVIIWYTIFMKTKKIGMTRKTKMDFFKPVLCKMPYIAKGRFLSIKDRDIHATAWMEDEQGGVCARVDALFREAKDFPREHFINRLDFSHTSPEIKRYFLSILE